MFYIVVASILVVVSLIGFGIRWATKGSGDEMPFGLTLVVPFLLVIFTLFCSVTTVDARAVGIQTGLGRYVGTMDSGLHFKAPWTKVEEFTTVIQTTDLEGDQKVQVAFKGGGGGDINATFRWSIKDDQSNNGAKSLWEKYRTFDAVSESLVYRDGKGAILNVANDYTANDARTKQDVIGREIETQLETTLEKYGIIVDSVSITSMELNNKTQTSLDKVVSAQNDVERARAEKERAKIDNETIELREKSGALSPEANQRYCLEIANNWSITNNGPMPATFDCSLSASGSPVIVDSTKAK